MVMWEVKGRISGMVQRERRVEVSAASVAGLGVKREGREEVEERVESVLAEMGSAGAGAGGSGIGAVWIAARERRFGAGAGAGIGAV